MNKSLLIKQNNELFSKIQVLKSRNSALSSQVAKLNSVVEDYLKKIECLESEISALKALKDTSAIEQTSITSDEITQVTTETNDLDIAEPEEVELPDDFNYASDVIGNIVIKAAGFINELTVSAKENKKELINLILGRTEIAKAEILNAVSSDVGLSAKQELIDTQYNEAFEYFKSIMEQ